MLRKLLIAGLLAAAVTVPVAGAQPKLLMPGVTYEKQVQFTTHGPVAVHVLIAPRPGGLWSLEPALSNEAVLGTEKLTALEQRLSAGATVAGVGGDLFSADGRPSGVLMRGGALDHTPLSGRSSVGVDGSGALRVDRVALLATWQGAGPRRAVNAVNDPPGPNAVSLFTPAWGPETPAVPGSVQIVLSPFPPAAPNVELAGTSAQPAGSGPAPISVGNAVLVARGTAAQRLAAEAPAGQQVKIRLILQPDWTGVVGAIGGGPALVRNGVPVFRPNEGFTTDQLLLRAPRAAVGQLADGRVVLVAVDGGLPGYSTGMTSFELAQTLVRLGAVTGAALGSGAATAMAFEGRLLSRPSDPGGELPVSDALLVAYAGVYAPDPTEPVLSPNGDGIAESESLAYKVVRPSTVTVNLLGPDGAPRLSSSGQAEPGTYPVTWTGSKEDGSPEVEGRWRFVVSAVDDLGRSSSVEGVFSLNLTLGFPKTMGPALAVPRQKPRAVAAFALTRPAVVTTRIETASGVVLRSLGSRRFDPSTVQVAWDGVTATGAVVYSGRYVARAIAKNELGSVDLAAPFVVRRVVTRAQPAS